MENSPSALTMELRKFLYSQAIVAAAVLAADLCSFAFYALALRFSPESFAEVTSVTALQFVLTVCSATVGTYVLMRCKESGSPQQVAADGMRTAMTVGVSAALLFVLVSPLLARMLHFASPAPFLILGAGAVPGMLVSVLQSLQTARRHFVRLAVGIVLLAAVRIPAGLLFFHDGYHPTDAPLSIVSASSLTLVLLLAMNGHGLRLQDFVPRLLRSADVRSMAELLWSLFVVGALLKMDVLWAKHALDARSAGIYGMTSLVASVLHYATMGVSRPALSYVTEGSLRRIVHWSISAILVACAAGVVGYFVIGERLFAAVAEHAADMRLPALALLFVSMTSYSILSFCIQCLGVLHRSVHVTVMSAVVVADALLLPIFGVSVVMIAAVQMTCVTIGACASYLVLLRQTRRKAVA